MENYRLIAASLDNESGEAFIVQGDELFYGLYPPTNNVKMMGIEPHFLVRGAARHRAEWNEQPAQNDELLHDLAERIEVQKKVPFFAQFCADKLEEKRELTP